MMYTGSQLGWRGNQIPGRVIDGRAMAALNSRYPGMGEVDNAMIGKISSLGVQTAGTIMSGVATSSGAALGMTAAVAVPVIGAVVAGVTLALMAIFNRKGPKQKVATTKIVNDVEPELQKNLAGYLSGPRTKSSQAQALENFKAGWAYVVEYCDTPVMGNPGKACVNDRNRGGQWDWWSYYYDPIANDTQVTPDPVIDPITGQAVTGAVLDPVTGKVVQGTLVSNPLGLDPKLLIMGGLLLAAVLVGGGSGK